MSLLVTIVLMPYSPAAGVVIEARPRLLPATFVVALMFAAAVAADALFMLPRDVALFHAAACMLPRRHADDMPRYFTLYDAPCYVDVVDARLLLMAPRHAIRYAVIFATPMPCAQDY